MRAEGGQARTKRGRPQRFDTRERRDSIATGASTAGSPPPPRRPRLEGRSFVALRLLSDVVALTAAVGLAAAARWGEESFASRTAITLALPPLTVVLLYARGRYSQQLRPVVTEEVAAVASTVSIASMLLIAVSLLTGITERPGVAVAPVWALGFLLTASGRSALVGLQARQRMTGAGQRPAVIVGAGLIGAHIARRLQGRPEYGLHPVGFLDSDPLRTVNVPDRMPPLLGGPEQLSEVVRTHQVVHVILGFINDPDRRLLPLVRECQRLGLQVSVVPRLFDAHSQHSTLEHLGGLPLIALQGMNPRGWEFAVKHLVDRVGAALLTVLLAPLMAAIAVAVKLSSPGPVLFRQRRVGRDGQFFELLKFRSMRMEPDRSGFRPSPGSAPGGVEGQDRRTRIGRWLRRTSLDELPQLFNVLKGEMSLIGPRPERPEFVDLFREDIERYGERHRVKSGITGWAQAVDLRGQTSLADRVEWDNFYIENWSLWLDFKIL
ncbi:MAG TPA: exopolysaccharide biosynthesis polyprenyl glycosylphosphotransferase, partial [Solirubrobacteraceae bacterium]|nr:exopolysaccharide biosynthesis polyprenyl glycosylphosphotransferase [Solirubrobacteraceae bacterium]